MSAKGPSSRTWETPDGGCKVCGSPPVALHYDDCCLADFADFIRDRFGVEQRAKANEPTTAKADPEHGLQPYSPEWIERRAAAFRLQAKEAVALVRRYEDEHPPHDEGVPCLDYALDVAEKALAKTAEKGSQVNTTQDVKGSP